MSKVEVIPGDLAKPQCGISAENQMRLLPEVQYVIHAAASIQFDNPIHTDLTLSYVASKAIADFASKVSLMLLHSWSFIQKVFYLWSLHIPGISRHMLFDMAEVKSLACCLVYLQCKCVEPTCFADACR